MAPRQLQLRHRFEQATLGRFQSRLLLGENLLVVGYVRAQRCPSQSGEHIVGLPLQHLVEQGQRPVVGAARESVGFGQ